MGGSCVASALPALHNARRTCRKGQVRRSERERHRLYGSTRAARAAHMCCSYNAVQVRCSCMGWRPDKPPSGAVECVP
jgi:hypothetical protein